MRTVPDTLRMLRSAVDAKICDSERIGAHADLNVPESRPAMDCNRSRPPSAALLSDAVSSDAEYDRVEVWDVRPKDALDLH